MIRSFENIGSIEKRGSVLEYEYFNQVNKFDYSQEVEKYFNPEPVQIKTQDDALRAIQRKYELQDYSDSYKDNSYIKYKDAMAIVEKCQPGNPENPSALFANALRKKVAESLGEQFRVKFFTAVGSHLDTKHGVDAFIKIYDQNEKEIEKVTLDISARDKGSSRADLLIIIDDEERDFYDRDSIKFDKEKFYNKINSEAKNIVQTLRTKLIMEKNVKDGKTVRSNSEDDYSKRRRPRISRLADLN